MKVYGFDDTGPHRGELLAATVPGGDLNIFGGEAICHELGWRMLSTSFSKARKALLAAMEEVGADDEMIRTVRQFKASYVPVVDAL